ncbi:MAG TPA: heterodisulfide reductase-related iron-sulfur binding cluster [Gemmatimonadaceae bacterium]|nr:heterodisulfide reductase-related iron-sulfur binding cluster [Gemmatimonadaceae bacterium]
MASKSVPLPCALPNTPLADAVPGINTCVHCGFCLQACPTYITLQDENDSPRGRIFLMRSLVEGTLSVDDPTAHSHIDRCLGCRACETACPSGVPYGQLLEATRATLTRVRPIPPVARTVLAVFARPRLLSIALGLGRLARATRLPRLLGRLLGGRLGFSMAMLAATEPAVERGAPYDPDALSSGAPGARGRAALLLGCVMEGLFAETNRATERTLRANGYAMADAPGQRCCGALHAHAGDADAARRLAKVNIAAFERSGADLIAVNAAGCGAMMKEYAHLLAGEPEWHTRAAAVAERVRDVSELLAAAGPRPASAPLGTRVTYDAPCHLLHAQRVVAPPLKVLGAAGVELVPLTDSDVCCGSAGIYNLVEPQVSSAVLAPKLAHIEATGALLVATGNPGCLMQIGAGLRRAGSRARVVHPVELLDAAYGREQQAGNKTPG